MGRSFTILVAALIFHLGICSQGEPADPHAHDKASFRIMDHNPSLLEVVESIQKESIMQTVGNKGLFMRAEVRKHKPLDNAAEDMPVEKNVGLLELTEVDCSSSASNVDNISRKLCSILEGASNAEIAGKLERAVKGLSLRTNSSDSTEAMISGGQKLLLRNLRSALWDLWFCAKRTECDVSHSREPKIMAARQQAFDALQAMRTHMLSMGVPGSAQTDAHTSALIERGSAEQLPAAGASEWAQGVMADMLSSGNVTATLWEAIHKCNLNDIDMKDIVTVSKNEEENFKKFREAMLILHECATMPDCPSTSGDCCNPKSSDQPRFKDAREKAYIAYNQIMDDSLMASQAYHNMLTNILGEPTTTPKLAINHNDGGNPEYDTTLYPPGHPNTYMPRAAITTTTAKPVVAEGNILLYAICGVGAIVVPICLYAAMFGGKAAGGGEQSWQGEESWGEGGW